MKENEILGKVLWWSERDENGIICDSEGNEFYFDSSVVKLKKRQKLESETLVIFTPSRCEKLLVAKKVSIPSSEMKGKYSRRFEEEKCQLRLPIAM